MKPFETGFRYDLLERNLKMTDDKAFEEWWESLRFGLEDTHPKVSASQAWVQATERERGRIVEKLKRIASKYTQFSNHSISEYTMAQTSTISNIISNIADRIENGA